MNIKEALSVFLRYILLVIAPLGGLWFFYTIFRPLTVFPSYLFLKLVDSSTELFYMTTIFFRGEYIELIGACIAGAAYYLLLILNMTTRMPLKKRLLNLVFLWCVFLIANILRILVFVFLAYFEFTYFDLAHSFVWYVGSTVFVVLVWFVSVKIFRIDSIPVYDDFKDLTKEIVGE